MPKHQNPLIQENPLETMYNVRSILSTLQEFYSASDLPDREQTEETYCGLYWILKCADHALEYEIERCGKG